MDIGFLLDLLVSSRVKQWKDRAVLAEERLKNLNKNYADSLDLVKKLENQITDLQNKLNEYNVPAPATKGNISYQDLMTLVKTQLGNHVTVNLSDSDYKLIPKEEMDRFLKEDKTNTYNYVSEYFDCDDFSFKLMGAMKSPEWASIAFGVAWGDTPGGSHAFNCFVDSSRILWLIEPQSDKIFKKPNNWKVWFVII